VGLRIDLGGGLEGAANDCMAVSKFAIDRSSKSYKEGFSGTYHTSIARA
jgi:hypothetical protein